MTAAAERFREEFLRLLDEHARPGRLVLGLSGGRDSMVLLQLLAPLARDLGIPLEAVHVNHRLQADADTWQQHCRSFAEALQVPYCALQVTLDDGARRNIEARARTARYAALESRMQAGDWLLTAHHADDQAETVLLNLMRGSGVAGVRGIAHCRPCGPGLLLRPLLAWDGAELAAYAASAGIEWIDDPSNADTGHDRNYLRHEVLPRLVARWPAALRQLARSASLARDAAELVEERATADLADCGTAERIGLAALARLPGARARNVLRCACRRLRLAAPPSAQVAAVLGELAEARADAAPLVAWNGAEARRYHDALYLMPALGKPPAAPAVPLTASAPLALGVSLGTLSLVPGRGLSRDVVDAGLKVRYREGGERLCPAGHARHRALKKLLQEAGIVPWMRARIPLLYAGDTLVAAGDLWVAAEHHAEDGLAVRWDDRPTLY